MSTTIQSIRGMHDILPDQVGAWQRVEAVLRALTAAYGYREIRVPVVERTELFARSIGEVTDIVEKEMYSFRDRNGDGLTLRPECTASCVRAGIQHGLLNNRSQRLWYLGPMFRHERPQKGRYRQFHQFGIEAFGFEGPDIDAEQIVLTDRLWAQLGLPRPRLEINSLGSPEARAHYRDRLVDYLRDNVARLDEDSRRRLETNPLRVLDSKNPDMAEVIAGAPVLLEHLDPASAEHFEGLRALLDALEVSYRVNPRLVRGLDYYTRTVFEWISDALGAQGTVCAGGRYDGLVEQLGGRLTPAAGFALGLERVIEMLPPGGEDPATPQVYLVAAGSGSEQAAMALAEALRRDIPGLRLVLNCGGGSFKAQLRRADASGAALALILGESELREGTASIKPLRGGGEQETVARERLAARLERMLAPAAGGRP